MRSAARVRDVTNQTGEVSGNRKLGRGEWIALVVAVLTTLATVSVPIIERWLNRKSIQIQVVEPFKLSLIENDEESDPRYLSIILIENSGWQTVSDLSLPIAFKKDEGRIVDFKVTTRPTFTTRIGHDLSTHQFSIDTPFLNPGDAINLAVISTSKLSPPLQPRVENLDVTVQTRELNQQTTRWYQNLLPFMNLIVLLLLAQQIDRRKKFTEEIEKKLNLLNLRLKDRTTGEIGKNA